MPFPLAHPAAVLPLRRWCPRYLSFPALIIGSLTPDLGYAFERFDLAGFSHRPLAGTFGFCLPAGLVLVLGFYLVRLPLVRLLPGRYRAAFLPLCQQAVASPLAIIISLLLGALTHQGLDALTHPQFWLVRYIPALFRPAPVIGLHRFLLCQVLYAGCTFGGVAWLALAYLRWWERNAGASLPRGLPWICSLLLAGGILWVALDARSYWHHLGSKVTATWTVLLVAGFLIVVQGLSAPPGHRKST